jgi:anti-sigma factor RsiW
MSSDPVRLGLEELSAYVDGESEGHRRDEVEAHLGRCPADADLVAAYRRLDQGLRQGMNSTSMREGGPWLDTVCHAGRLRWRRERMTIAAAIMLLLMSGSGAWWLRGAAGQPADLVDLARDAAAIYRVYAVAPPIPQVQDDHDRERLASRLSSRIGTQIRVPDLERFGFRLAGEELLTTEHGTAAQLTYTDATGRRLTCFFRHRPTSGDEGLRVVEEDGLVTSYGADDDFGYAITARIGRTELLAIAEAVYEAPSS